MAARPAQFSPGHEVDLLLANELLGSAAGRVAPVVDPPGLHVCPDCTLPFVVPGEVHEVIETERVRLELGCTNCGWSAVAVHTDTELTALDLQLDRSFADLLWTLEVVWTANEESAIERFAAALDAGLLLPEDF
ncbi:MAG: hypothetical protein JWM73_1665 [Solirubrobacterales bacterium]|nr:hypothetical protein [Solirubrobacterales bacterium]